jgi:hypothetical protein
VHASRSLHADACNPLLQAHLTWARDNTKAVGFPFYACLPLASPLRAPSRADPSRLGHAAIVYSSVQGPPGVEMLTVGVPGRSLLRVDEQLPVKLQMGRDGNGYPRPDTRWVFTPLGYVCGLNILLVGLLLGKNLHPMGKRVLERSAFTHTR